MALKFKLKSKDEVPAELVNLYVERDGAWHLDVEGAVDPASVEELRRASKAKLEEAQQIKAGEVEKVVETRLRAVKGDLDKKLASATVRTDAEGRFCFEKVCEGQVSLSATRQNLSAFVRASAGETNVLLKLRSR